MSRRPDWRDLAACRGEDPELFFPKGADGPWLLTIEQAKTICRRCPVLDACLTFALNNPVPDGIYGGLTEIERRSLTRARQRHTLTADAITTRADDVRDPRPARTLQTIYDDSTSPLKGGHTAWTGAPKTSFQGQVYTPKQLAFTVDRGRPPLGIVRSECGITECVLPAHIADVAERERCGTRTAYQRHLQRGETPCGPCRQANTDADRRLRNTGTTRAAA